MAATTTISAHVLVEFSAGNENFTAFAEVDDREFGYNGGGASFLPSQDVYLLLFKPTGFTTIYNEVTSGVLTKITDVQKQVDEYIQFANEDSASVRYPIDSSFTYNWIGKDLGVVSQTQFGVSIPVRPIDTQTQLPIPEYRVGIARIQYLANCEVWKMSSVPINIVRDLAFFVVKQD